MIVFGSKIGSQPGRSDRLRAWRADHRSRRQCYIRYGLQRMVGTKTNGEKVELWFRATACFRRDDGEWRITHMHNSVPFAMDGSDKALLDLRP